MPGKLAEPTTYQQRLERLRPRLLAFARLQLRFDDQAEDAVQEALLAALNKLDSFDGRSQFETWVFGILRYKILDIFRYQKRRASWMLSEEALPSEEELDRQFKSSGFWESDARPQAWGDPEEALTSSHFWRVFDACMIHLPDVPARVFSLRELMEVEICEICELLGITENNCSVILYRARMKLRQCLEKGWISEEKA
ncbi:MAG: sigma-70 family RNA polymerase sigma factor [Marinospirillum sp.]|uniref:sigma-70 family RNA polymerase sigma factor n=1 Tax=Marinospirillum sp. TaxID=2183934 RepID=UPI001A0BC930|nr:sigma-70 family RNA polymerase sigma factor [Marinospirillum sp.]MBE0508402.1 sigma-70 family RNA polymerase sigma factor [Marinospirillum sp.]